MLHVLEDLRSATLPHGARFSLSGGAISATGFQGCFQSVNDERRALAENSKRATLKKRIRWKMRGSVKAVANRP
ncbi:hypothetical protein [Desulfovibrio porci]|uniref:hypothetical protein n=1 Tax=Desulfovibrio porci TaxID=2605782 RepID=UPI003A8F2A7C